MLAVIQRVSESSVKVEGNIIGEIGLGLNVLLGVFKGDEKADSDALLKKITELRIFADENGKMNKSVLDAGGSLLVISQFTLAGDVRKGRRPSFDFAEKPDPAKALYDYFVSESEKILPVQTGKFGAMMDVHIQNDGPVTFIIDSKSL